MTIRVWSKSSVNKDFGHQMSDYTHSAMDSSVNKAELTAAAVGFFSRSLIL
jgi:hypothetical protein